MNPTTNQPNHNPTNSRRAKKPTKTHNQHSTIWGNLRVFNSDHVLFLLRLRAATYHWYFTACFIKAGVSYIRSTSSYSMIGVPAVSYPTR